jgi:hypothetical protein
VPLELLTGKDREAAVNVRYRPTPAGEPRNTTAPPRTLDDPGN